MAEPLHNVAFQASRTNSVPAPKPELPFHIEKALYGEVGTTRLPIELSRISRFLGRLVTLLVFFGTVWLLRQTPVVAIILATIIACISMSMSGLYFGIPYLRQRRSEWTAANWWLLNAAVFVVWLAGLGVVHELVYNPFKIGVSLQSILSPLFSNKRRIEEIQKQLWTARYDCDYKGCKEWRIRLEKKLADAQAPQHEWAWISDGEAFDPNILFIAASVLLGVAVGISAYGRPSASEATNAIWREPHTGYPGNPISTPSAPTPKPADDPEAAAIFRNWLSRCVKMDPAQSVKFNDAYAKYRDFCVNNKSAPLTVDAFKTRMKSDAGIEPINGVYQGVAIGEGII